MIILYVLLTGVCFVLLMRWRTQRLEKEKQRLESIVGERTAEVVKQRDEIVKQKD
jgi:cytochrome oxidase assembly protein ShyY1